MATNYDKIAGNYDLLSRIVFGKAQVASQLCLLKYVPANSRVLVAGGGTGWILEAFAKVHPEGLTIDYVDSSAKMLALAGKRKCGTNRVKFIHLPAENYSPEEKYDVIFTAFFFDNFPASKIEYLFSRFDRLIKKDGTWLYVDFILDKNNSPLWQKILLKLMYVFFRVTSQIETQELVAMDIFFSQSYYPVIEISHYHNFIKSVAFKKL